MRTTGCRAPRCFQFLTVARFMRKASCITRLLASARTFCCAAGSSILSFRTPLFSPRLAGNNLNDLTPPPAAMSSQIGDTLALQALVRWYYGREEGYLEKHSLDLKSLLPLREPWTRLPSKSKGTSGCHNERMVRGTGGPD